MAHLRGKTYRPLRSHTGGPGEKMSSEIVSGKVSCECGVKKPGQLGGERFHWPMKTEQDVQKQITHKGISAIVMALAVCMACFSRAVCVSSRQTRRSKSNLTPKLDASATINEGVLTVGINANNSPYGGTNASNQTVGIDVDVAAAIAQELGLRMQIVDVGSRVALPQQQANRRCARAHQVRHRRPRLL